MPDRLLICTDLDRTLLPNGPQPESPGARPGLHALAEREQVRLAYVTGRHRALVEEAVTEYELPGPDYVVGDVGTSIYAIEDGAWTPWPDWNEQLASSWGEMDGLALTALFEDIPELTAQEPQKQGRFKSSYYAPVSIDAVQLQQRMMRRLAGEKVPSHIIWSIDDIRQIGLLDILPVNASKLHALRFLMKKTGHKPDNTLFAGDSGNDLAVLSSEIPSVLVANASDAVRRQAVQLSRAAGTMDAFYAARGGFRGMNGNYSAGILEGLVHFMPATEEWIP
ncbi:MAG: HAD-IIB family hydrolase [Thiogranum sp.]|nr:HAD-IIB family hydrolase [Thiogranum sp.]